MIRYIIVQYGFRIGYNPADIDRFRGHTGKKLIILLVVIIIDSRFSVAAAFIVAARMLLHRLRIVAEIVNGLYAAEKVFTAEKNKFD